MQRVLWAHRLVRLYEQHIGEDAALLRGEDALVTLGVEHRGTLLERNRAQILEGALHHRLALHRQGRPAVRREVDAHLFLRRQMLDHYSAGETALALLLGQLVYLVQLLHHTLLLGRRKPAEVGVAAKHTLLLLYGKIVVLIEPVAQVAGRALNRRGIPRINRAGVAGAEVGRTGIAGAGCWVAGTGCWVTGQPAARCVGSRPSLGLGAWLSLVSRE